MLLYFKLHMIDKIINFNLYYWISVPEVLYMFEKKKSVRAMIIRKSWLFLHHFYSYIRSCVFSLWEIISEAYRNKNCSTCFG